MTFANILKHKKNNKPLFGSSFSRHMFLRETAAFTLV